MASASIALEHGLLLVGERLIGAVKVLGLHAMRLRPGFHLQRLIERHVPLALELALGDRIARTRSPVIRVKRRSPASSIRVRGPMISWTSPPEQKLPPAPRSTTTFATRVCFNCQKASRSSS